MQNLLPLSYKPAADGSTDIIINHTKCNYVDLGGINSVDAIECVYQCLYQYDMLDSDDDVVLTQKFLNDMIPNITHYRNISFVLKFYDYLCETLGSTKCVDKPNTIDLIAQKQNELTDLVTQLIQENVETSNKNIELEKRMADIRLLLN